MAFSFLHAADIHLDSPLHGLQRYDGAPVDEIRQATRVALQRLVQLAITRRVNFVVIAGDLYDGDWRDYNTGLYFVAQAQRLADAGIPLFLIAGNHDAQSVLTKSLTLPANTQLLAADRPQTVILDECGVALHGQSFANKAVFEDLSAAYPRGDARLFNIGILHTSAAGSEGHEPYAPCTLEGLRSRQYQYWALGHVHQRGILCEDPWITFSGNVQGRHIRETGPKGCWLVTVNDRQEATMKFEPLDVLRWERVTVAVDGLAVEDDVLLAVERDLRSASTAADGLPLAVRVELTGRTVLHDRWHARREHLVAQLRSIGVQAGSGRVWIEKVSLHTQPQRQTTSSLEPADGPWEELAAYIEELRSRPDEVAALAADVRELSQRLPEDVDLTSIDLSRDGTENWNVLLDDAAALLQHRLTGGEVDA
jgi:exonuclease SbcD